jgi:hypothetical protein
MKSFILKSIASAFLVLPTFSYAINYTNCGLGTIRSLVVKHDGNVGIEVNFISGKGQTEHEDFYYTSVASPDNAGIRSTLLSAFHSGSVVQFYGNGGCLNRIIAVAICTNSSCRASGITNYQWF